MYSQKNWKLLQGRYELLDPLVGEGFEKGSEEWVGVDGFDNEYLIKIWPYQEANDLKRALWDSELRRMYRVGSSPGAEKWIVVMREADLDPDHNCYVMVLQAHGSGYSTLDKAIKIRNQYAWLSNAGVDARRLLWLGLKRLADGIQLLHSQTILHRNVTAENIFFRPEGGPSSFRLAGFEWSLRVGELHLQQPPSGWSSPPDFADNDLFAYQPETDWYGFGVLAARCLLNIESLRVLSPKERHRRIVRAIDQASNRHLQELERVILQRLIDPQRRDRLMKGYEIDAALDDLLDSLGGGARADALQNPLILAYNPAQLSQNILERATANGFVPNADQPLESFNPSDIVHCTALSSFLQKDLAESQLHSLKENAFVLVGQRLELKISQLEERDQQSREKVRTWDVAYCIDETDLRWSEGGTTRRDLPPGSVIVRTTSEVWRGKPERGRAQNWERYLPYVDETDKLRANLAQFHNFIRCTNQMELLMRDAELFQYEVVERKVHNGVETLTIRDAERSRSVLEILKPEGGLVQFLQREIESGKRDCRLVILTPESQDSLRLELETRLEKKDCFIVEEVDDPDEDLVVLKRSCLDEGTATTWDRGWVRTFGMFGQVALIRRRNEAIGRLQNHSYLLRSLSAPGQVFMDTGPLPLPQEVLSEKVDSAKQAVMRDVLRTRPIYALQGPPGTGKTTMVAHLLRQIFRDDPVAQVLLAAQAHGAVDVLRAKVRDEAFGDVPETDQPLAIRIGTGEGDESGFAGSVQDVAAQALTSSVGRLKASKNLTVLQGEWIQGAENMIAGISGGLMDDECSEFCALLKRGANITYCTTSAGDLEELARSVQSFDWAIIEEAGKCHGFDLALPLQAGHRWLLIGDHNQLPPYRWEDYSKALVNLDRVIDALKELPNRAAGLLDFEWIIQWEGMDAAERNQFKEFCRHWLNTFRRIFENCEIAPSGSSNPRLTIIDSIGAAAGMLSRQYRMHPTIGTLISEVYYDGKLQNQTIDAEGRPKLEVILPVAAPEGIGSAAIVWIDTPPASTDDRAHEWAQPRYTNRFEVSTVAGFLRALRLDPEFVATLARNASPAETVKIAVLSPYTQQVIKLRQRLESIALPSGIVPKEELRRRKTAADNDKVRLCHTVDSFQGNEADIIVVSLVRNSSAHDHHDPLGFLWEPARMNVLLSRAQRLLVLVGSWDFFLQQVKPFSLDDRSRREWRLKKAITVLSDFFDSGHAVKLDAYPFWRNGR